MSNLREGQRIAFCGDPVEGLVPGDCGKVLSSADSALHVLFSTGLRAGEVVLVEHLDVVESRTGAKVYDDLDSGRLVTISVRDTWESQGKVALLNALNEEGHLAGFASIADRAMQMVAAEIRQDPSFREVLAHLDADEGADLVDLASTALLHDAFGGPETDA